MPFLPELQTPHDMQLTLAGKARRRRLDLNMTQAELAERSGVSLGSLRRFERCGEISLASFLALAQVLGELAEFGRLFMEPERRSLFEKPLPRRERGAGSRRREAAG